MFVVRERSVFMVSKYGLPQKQKNTNGKYISPTKTINIHVQTCIYIYTYRYVDMYIYMCICVDLQYSPKPVYKQSPLLCFSPNPDM